MTGGPVPLAFGRSAPSRRRLAGWALVILLPLVTGCGGREEQTAPEKFARSPEAAEAVPAFNRDMHVIRELWKELKALEGVADTSVGKKRQTLRQALQERVQALNRDKGSLPDGDRQLLQKIVSERF
ncbi:MAG: hypothetical protein PHG96_00485 [Kiritimatiellae bacterium]|nr:hypothetical protein [Kiritimatiellia bacterium]MDD3543816.1 hypothetical protein [Kiritimatiellia bacterium]MDD4025110.1 hypothetical protein [Kiritimatiellia bacterium]MDD4622383.1 hypothetical protein [Kiritimatiellia bacterium]